MDFIFMLTRADQTITDCVEVAKRLADLGLRHIGFKDIGADVETLDALNTAIKDSGATSYLEVVSTSQERALESARFAARVGVDRLLGGTYVRETVDVLKGTTTEYYPFVGRPEGHPTRLGGSPDSVASDTVAAIDAGCAGVDLLAYRAFEADPLDLVRAARAASDKYLIVAGNVATEEQIVALAEAGADAFTIGSAAFAGSLDPRAGLLEGQLQMVTRTLNTVGA